MDNLLFRYLSFVLYIGGISCIVAGCGSRGVVEPTAVAEITVEESGVVISKLAVDLSESWPMWRGPLANGIATPHDIPVTWNETKSVKWRSDIPGRGHGSPVVVGNLILLATAIDSEKQQMVLAYDRETGSEQWRTVVHEGDFPASGEVHRKGTNANATVAFDGHRAFVAFFNSNRVFATALDRDGNKIWQTELGAFSSIFGYAPSPILYQSLVIIAGDNQGGGYIVALDDETGEIAWRIARPRKNSHSSPIIASFDGQDQLLISGCDLVNSYDPATGKQLWSTSGTSETTCGTMVYSKDKVFASGGYPGDQTVCLSTTGEVLWQNKINVYEPSMLVSGNSLFAITDKGIAYCWSAESGDEQWKERLGGSFSASPIVCNGSIYVSNLSGKTFVFEATSEGYHEVSVNKLGDDCYASPAIFGDNLFLRVGIGQGSKRQEQLCCIGK